MTARRPGCRAGGAAGSARPLVALGAATLLAACGFQLQGRTPLPKSLAVCYVEAKDQQSEFVQGLRRALRTAGARVTDESSDATAVVHVLQDAATPRVLAVSSADLPREYEITYSVRFSVTANGRDLLPAQEIALRRDYSFDEYVLLAKDNEDAILRAALARDLVGIAMRRLKRL
ncbi:MAG TPA: LPS assembly lipoprotein LptE [Steroidobacteraceae bacterium]|nr:LPS assembly lipoprotein LptE [Steroidobacteraceae bacterium]